MAMPEYQGERIIPGEPMVMVEQVIDRPTKDDCRNYTKTLWLGKGDVQPYPKRLWPKLAAHPDVWRLADDQTMPAYLASLAGAAKPVETKKEDPDGVLAGSGLPEMTAEELAAMTDDEVRGAAAMRRLGLHARLMPEAIRPKFLELQAAKAAARAGG